MDERAGKATDEGSRSRIGDAPRVAMVVEQLWQPVPGGSGTYIVELTRALRSLGIPVAGMAARHGGAPSSQEVGLEDVPVRFSALPRPGLYEAWNRLGRPDAEALVPGADVVHATTWAVPPSRRSPLVVTVHDLAFLRAPEHVTRRGVSFFRRSLARTHREAAAVIVPSQATADDCLAAGFESHRLTVIPHGVSTRSVVDAEVARFRRRRGLSRDYILWTGTREPRKNLPVLLDAFSRLARQRADLDLILVGPSGWGGMSQERDLVQGMSGRVHVLGRLDEDDLAASYAGARVFAFPSIWEGFGLPVLEAMAYGTPVVTSAHTSMAEVCGEAALLVDAASPEDLARALDEAAGNAHDDLARAGLARASLFTWEACSRAHATLYGDLARSAA